MEKVNQFPKMIGNQLNFRFAPCEIVLQIITANRKVAIYRILTMTKFTTFCCAVTLLLGAQLYASDVDGGPSDAARQERLSFVNGQP